MITTQKQQVLTLPFHFEELLRNIRPPKNRRDAAKKIPADVRAYLTAAEDFATMAPHSQLTGSYARHTAIHAIKDVDFLIFVPYLADGREPEPEALLDDLFRTLGRLPKALGYGGRPQKRRRQRRSIHVDFDEEDFCLDVVPALAPNGTAAPLLVPDREWRMWVPSHPLGYATALSALNANSEDKAVPLIKMFKHWRTVQMQRRTPKSYYLEVIAYQQLEQRSVVANGSEYAESFTELLRSVRDAFLPAYDADVVPAIADPMLGNNIAFNWEQAAFDTFMNRLDESIGWAERALAMGQDQIDEAIKLWQRIFGSEYFTDTPAVKMMEKASLLRNGSVFVGAAGEVSHVRPAQGPSVEVPPHRFYGQDR